MDIFFIEMVASRRSLINKQALLRVCRLEKKNFFLSDHACVIGTPEYWLRQVDLVKLWIESSILVDAKNQDL